MNRSFRHGMSAYRNVDINTRNTSKDQHELVMMMFEGVIESAHRAQGAILNQDSATKVAEISRAVRILQEGLRTSLDLENGGELAQNLANLYDYCATRLAQANARNDAEALAEVSRLMKQVADAWKQMRTGVETQAPEKEAPSLHQPAPPTSMGRTAWA